MIISISGAQCTGKTTLIEALKKERCLEGSLFMGSPSRKGNDRGIRKRVFMINFGSQLRM